MASAASRPCWAWATASRAARSDLLLQGPNQGRRQRRPFFVYARAAVAAGLPCAASPRGSSVDVVVKVLLNRSCTSADTRTMFGSLRARTWLVAGVLTYGTLVSQTAPAALAVECSKIGRAS